MNEGAGVPNLPETRRGPVSAGSPRPKSRRCTAPIAAALSELDEALRVNGAARKGRPALILAVLHDLVLAGKVAAPVATFASGDGDAAASAGISALLKVKGKAPVDLVFLSARGSQLRVSLFRNRVFAPAVQRCQAVDPEFPTVTPHDLRHTAASLAISAGANVKAVQTMLGHASAAMTLDTYSDLFPDDLDAVATRLHEARSEIVGKMWAKLPRIDSWSGATSS